MSVSLYCMHLYNYVINNYNSRDVPRKLWAHLSTCNTHTNSMLIVVCSNLYDELAQYNYNNNYDGLLCFGHEKKVSHDYGMCVCSIN